MTQLLRIAAPLLAIAGTADLATAGWNNVYQVTCFGCRPRVVRSDSYSAPARTPANVETISRYETETVTVMKPVREEVLVPTTERRSYYEPIVSHSRSSYYNPVTGCCETVDVPKTSFRLRTDCSTVMTPVERLRMVPTQVERQVEVRRKVYTYYGPEERIRTAPVCALPNTSSGAAPQVDIIRSQGPTVAPDGYTPITPPGVSTTPQAQPRAMPPAKVNARTTSRSGSTAVRGEVVRADQATPLAGAKLVLVSATDKGTREYTTADEFGRFDVTVPAGTWHLYVGDGKGRASFHKTVKLDDAAERTFTVVSR